jgi:hypothetical protein
MKNLKNVLNKIVQFFQTLAYGFMPAIAGGCITMDVYYIIKNIQEITVGSGWSVVLNFVYATSELILAIILLYRLGQIQMNSKEWLLHKRLQTANTINSGSLDCETSDEAVDI